SRYIAIVDRQLQPLPEQCLSKRDKRSFPEVVGPRLEAEAQDPHAPLSRLQHHLDPPFNLLPIALHHSGEHGRLHVNLPRLMDQGPQVLRETRATEGKDRLQEMS